MQIYLIWLFFLDRKPPGVGRGRGRGREDGPGGRPAKGIGRGLEDVAAKGMGGGRGRGGPGGKIGGSRGKTELEQLNRKNLNVCFSYKHALSNVNHHITLPQVTSCWYSKWTQLCDPTNYSFF